MKGGAEDVSNISLQGLETIPDNCRTSLYCLLYFLCCTGADAVEKEPDRPAGKEPSKISWKWGEGGRRATGCARRVVCPLHSGLDGQIKQLKTSNAELRFQLIELAKGASPQDVWYVKPHDHFFVSENVLRLKCINGWTLLFRAAFSLTQSEDMIF